MPKDPKRWSDPLIATPNATLTKRDVHDYYAQKAVQKRIRAAVGAGDMLVRQSFEPGNNVLRRKSPEGDNIKFKDLLKIPRITEAHQTFGKKVNFLLADVDPQPDVPWEKTKSIAETIAKTMAMHDDVKDVQVRFSGNRGFYVQGNMDKKIDVNKAREVTKKVLHGIAQRPDVTFGVADKGQIRIDLTPLKNKGSIKAPYSLDARTGLVSAPVKVDDIGKVKKTDFEIGKIKMAANDYLATVKNDRLRADLERAMSTYDTVEDEAHGRPHVENVIRAAHRMNKLFGLPLDHVTAAAVLHDIGNPVDRKHHAEIGAELSPQYLQSLPPRSRASIIHAVREHRFSEGNPRSRLAKLINDADTISDFVAPNDQDYFFRRLVKYRKSKGMPKEDVYDEAREYGRPWLRRALHGGLRTQEALESFKPRLWRAYRQTQYPDKFKKFLQPIVEEEYGALEPLQKESTIAKKKEFAPGIPAARSIDPIPNIKNKAWTLAVQKHEAERAGTHYDLRLVDPTTNQAHSFAVPKAKLPGSNDRPLLAVQQPTHTADYALRFTGTIPKGTYGAGKVTMPIKEKVQIIQSNADKIKFQRPNGAEFVLFRMQGNNWGLKKKKTS